MIKVEHWNEEQDGELSEQAMQAKLEALGYSCSIYHYPAGTYFPDHTHEVDKIDGVLSGRFLIGMSGQSVTLEAGDCIHVPKGAVHNAEVSGLRSPSM